MPVEDKAATSRVSADNQGPGSQYVLDGHGDQNVISEKGVMYKVSQQHNYYTLYPGKEISSAPQSLEELKARSPENITHGDVINWLGEQSAQATKGTRQYQLTLRKQMVPKTGEWVIDKQEFRSWKDTSDSSRILCCMHGMLGSGKTMLVSVIVEHIEREIKNVDENICLYFYFQEGEKHCASRMWKALLMQLLERTCVGLTSELKATFNDLRHGSMGFDSTDCLDLFKAQAEAFGVIYLIIDSLNNCEDAPGEMTRQALKETLETFPSNIRVLFTSRDDLVSHEDERYHKLFIEPNQQDVKSYVEKRINDDTNLSKQLANGTTHRDIVISSITATTMAHKMFLLARLHMDNLREKKTVREIIAALGTLPDSPSEAVDLMVQKIRKEKLKNYDSRLADHTLTWVLRAKVKLTFAQIQDSFAVRQNELHTYKDDRPGRNSLLRACNGLITIDEEETFGLVHKLFQTQLEKNLIPKSADLDIAKTCLYYLLADTHGNEREPPLLQYAATYWYDHLSSSQIEVDSTAKKLVWSFLTDSSKVTRAFISMGDVGGGTFDGMTGLHAAVHYNLASWAENLLKSGKKFNVNAQCTDGQTALHWAVRYNRLELVELFIKSADPNIQDKDGDTPLHKGLIGPTADKMNIIEILIDGKARLDIRNHKGISPILSAIHHGPTPLASRMIESQDNIDAEIYPGWTLLRHIFCDIQAVPAAARKGGFKDNERKATQLQHAANNRPRILTDLLFDRGANLNLALGKDGWTPLVYAIQTENLSQMYRLLTREPKPADVHLRNSKGKTPLWWAVSHKKIAAIQLLVEHGANVNEPYEDGSTPLLNAIRQKCSTIAHLLIGLGADLNIKKPDKSTLLIEAIRSGDHDTCLVLINAGVQLDEKDAKGKSPLLYAIENNDKALVALLLEKETTAAKSHNGTRDGTESIQGMQGSIGLAVKRNDFSMAWLLCNYGASLDFTNDDGQTFLHRAAIGGDLPGVRFLVAQGAAIDTRDKHGFTPLHYAAAYYSKEIVALLASQTSQSSRDTQESHLDIVDNKGLTALALAIHNKRLDAVQTLISHGASCNIQNRNGKTALHLAAETGFREGMELLLRRGANPNMKDRKGRTPIHWAIASGHGELVRLLVEEGADLKAYDTDQRTPWMLAAQIGNKPLAQYLLERHEAVRYMY